MKSLFSLLILISFAACQPEIAVKKETMPPSSPSEQFLLGIDNFLNNKIDMVKGKRVALLTNPSGVNADLIYTSDLLFESPEVNLTSFFGPEHGIRGDFFAGQKVSDVNDPKTGLMIYSLYGQRRKPTPETLENTDVIMVDIQDIGLRGYTYVYTMAKVMEAAADNDKQVIVLDRPNPVGGLLVEGNLVEEDYFSFVGLFPTPYFHGMTIGELALLFNEEFGIDCDLTVIPMLGWKRDMYWDDTSLSWVPTSPHVPHWETILYMGASGTFGELGTLSEGVGYTSPFETIGAPWINAEDFATELNALNLPGIYFRPLSFKPYYFRNKDKDLQGVQMHITDRNVYLPYATGLYIMQTHIRMYPDHDIFGNQRRISMFNKVMGTDKIMNMLKENVPVAKIKASWQDELDEFKETRKKYLLY
jgi:uncharacterized protein YbbC (DUF1343 family)